jgi:FixJ family two-component response regulator
MAEGPPLVMVVDDDAAIRDALKFVLRLEGVEVRAHATGAALLADSALSRAFCLILQDGLPEMDCGEVLRRVRALRLSLPAILLASVASPALRARAAAEGVWLVLEKPIMDNRLVEAVTQLLQDSHK